MTMAQLLNTITSIFVGTTTNGSSDNNGIIAWVGSIITLINNNPLLLLAVVLPIALIAIGVVRRLLSL